jgi:hypothetical protein
MAAVLIGPTTKTTTTYISTSFLYREQVIKRKVRLSLSTPWWLIVGV